MCPRKLVVCSFRNSRQQWKIGKKKQKVLIPIPRCQLPLVLMVKTSFKSCSCNQKTSITNTYYHLISTPDPPPSYFACGQLFQLFPSTPRTVFVKQLEMHNCMQRKPTNLLTLLVLTFFSYKLCQWVYPIHRINKAVSDTNLRSFATIMRYLGFIKGH